MAVLQLWRQAQFWPLSIHLNDRGRQCAAAAGRAQTVPLAQLALTARLLQSNITPGLL